MSSTILTVIVLVVMWLVVLVPMFVRRADDPAELAELAEFAEQAGRVGRVGSVPGESDESGGSGGSGESAGNTASARVLARRALAGRIDDVESEFDRIEEFYGSAAGFAGPADDLHGEEVSGEVDTGGLQEFAAPHTARARMIVRRRRTLAILAALILGTLVLVLLARGRPGAWVIQVGCDVLLAGYLVGLRREAQRERTRRLARATAARAAVRAEAQARRAARTDMPARRAPARPLGSGAGGARPRPARDHLSLAEPTDDPVEHRRVV